METQDMIQAVLNIIDSLGLVGFLVWALVSERKRSDMLFGEIVSDWKRQNDQLAVPGD